MSKVFDLINKEAQRQNNNIELIASENFVSDDILKALGSILTNKYAEGFPTNRTSGNKGRYYGGCEYVDELEEYCCDMWRKAFNTDYHVNVQPHSGSQANIAAYCALATPGSTILSMNLDNGGHLSHGSKVNLSGKIYNFLHYNIDDNGFIDYENIRFMIKNYHPAVVVAGASAYSRIIDFEKIRSIIDDIYKNDDPRIKPYFMVDMAHIAGLVASGDHPTPFGYADVITTTTHKTLRGPRGGIIFCKPELAKKIDSAIFPGNQGGPLMNIIAAKAIAAEEVCTKEYKEYIHQVVHNCKVMCNEFIRMGYKVITNGTDNHLFLIDFSNTHPNLTGKMIQDELDKHGITLNKNCVPNEKRSPMQASGVRIGTAAMTTKGWDAKDFVEVAHKIDSIIKEMER